MSYICYKSVRNMFTIGETNVTHTMYTTQIPSVPEPINLFLTSQLQLTYEQYFGTCLKPNPWANVLFAVCVRNLYHLISVCSSIFEYFFVNQCVSIFITLVYTFNVVIRYGSMSALWYMKWDFCREWATANIHHGFYIFVNVADVENVKQILLFVLLIKRLMKNHQ